MGKKQKLLDENYKKFKEEALSSLDPVIANFASTLQQLDSLVDSLMRDVQKIQSVLWLVQISTFGLSEQVRQMLEDIVSRVKPYQTALKAIKTAVRSLRNGGLNDVLEAYRPYIDTALFEGTKFQNVIVLNKASVNIYESSKTVFQDIKYQLSDNQSEAIEALDKLANRIVVNLVILIDQLKRGSIDV